MVVENAQEAVLCAESSMVQLLNALGPAAGSQLVGGPCLAFLNLQGVAIQPRRSSGHDGHYCRRLGLRMQLEGSDRSSQGMEGASVGERSSSMRRDGVSRRGLVSGVWTTGLAAMLSAAVLGGGAAPSQAGGIKDWEVPAVGYKTKTGLTYFDVRPGEGESPKWGQVTIFHYEGYVRSSPDARLVLFDDTYSRNTPYLHKHGNGRVIRGLDEGLHTMKLGGLRRIVIPLEQGFTKVGLGPLPPNGLRRKILAREITKAEESVPRGEIVYDVELVSIYDDEADLGYYEDVTYDPDFLRQGVIDAMQKLKDDGVKIPSVKQAAMVKPEILTAPVIDEAPKVIFRQ